MPSIWVINTDLHGELISVEKGGRYYYILFKLRALALRVVGKSQMGFKKSTRDKLKFAFSDSRRRKELRAARISLLSLFSLLALSLSCLFLSLPSRMDRDRLPTFDLTLELSTFLLFGEARETWVTHGRQRLAVKTSWAEAQKMNNARERNDK